MTEIAKKLNRSIKTISSQKKSAMMKLGVDNDIALLNYLSSVTLSATDEIDPGRVCVLMPSPTGRG